MGAEDFSGIWRSRYTYQSSSREGEFTVEHLVRMHRSGSQLVVESVPKVNESYLVLRLSLDGDVATGSWQEHTSPDGPYHGAAYHGAIQLVVHDGKRRMSGKWVGFGKDKQVNTGPWEFEYVGEQLPAAAA